MPRRTRTLTLLVALVVVAAVLRAWAGTNAQAQNTDTRVALPLIALPEPMPTATATSAPVSPTATPTGRPVAGNCSADPDPAAAPNVPIQIVALDKNAENVTVRNTGTATINLDGWVVCSLNGNQRHFFPPGVFVPPGAERTLESVLGTPIWNNSERDDAVIYDPSGRLISYFIDVPR